MHQHSSNFQDDQIEQDDAQNDENSSQDGDNISTSNVAPDVLANDSDSQRNKSWLERQTGLTLEDIDNNMENLTLIATKVDSDLVVDEIFQQRKVEDDPIPSHSADVDMKAFVEVFPCGKGGSTVDRNVKITKAQFEKTQLMTSDGNVRRNVQYHFHNMQQKEFRAINSGIFQVSNKSSGSKMTKKELKEGIEKEDRNIIGKISTLLGNLPTQNEFWRRIQEKIMAMIDKYGPPTFWLTLSPGEYDDEELYAYLKEMNRDLPGVDKMKLSTLISKDPVLAGHYISKKFDATYDFILDSGVIGQVGALTQKLNS